MTARSIVLSLAAAAAAAALAVGVAAVPPPPAERRAAPLSRAAAPSDLLLAFEPNVGQAEPRVGFVGTTPGATALVSADALRIALPGGARAGVRLVGSDPGAAVEGDAPLPGVSHRLVGRDPSRWAIEIPRFARVRARAVYPGIDLEVHAGSGRVEYDLVVAAGADARCIALAGDGGDARIDDGALVVASPQGEVRFERPVAYQVVRGERRAVRAAYAVRDGAIGFEVGPYDRAAPLVIDPVLELSRATSGIQVYAIAALPDDGIVLAGQAFSPSLAIPGAPPPPLAGGSDAFVARLAADGTVRWATYLGGTGSDVAYGLAADPDGNVYVGGSTDSTDFPTTSSAFQPTCEGYSPSGNCSTAWVAKVSADGARVAYATYLASRFEGTVAGWDVVEGVAWAGGARACVTGYTASSGFPTTPDAFQPAFGGSSDAFVSCLDTSLSGAASLAYSTFLGGFGSEDARAIAADGAGHLFVAGRTDSSDFPVASAAQPSPGGGGDAFAAAFDGSGARLWATYLGGSSTDTAMAIAADGEGNAYLTGQTKSDDFPVLNALQPNAYGGSAVVETWGDAFVTRLGLDGALAFSTYLGGLQWDWGTGIAVRDGVVHVAGNTWSLEFPVLPGAIQTRGVNQSAFVTGFLSDGSAALYSTYLGGMTLDEAHAIAAMPSGDVVVAGFTNSQDFPVAGAPPVPEGGGAFVARLGPGARGTADLALEVAASVERGGAGSYAFRLVNHGPDAATGITLRVYPVENTWFGIYGPLQYEFATLAAGASVTLPITAVPDAPGPLTVGATVAGREADPDPSNDVATATVSPATSDLAVAIAAAPAYVPQGAEARFTVRLSNAGPDPAKDVALAAGLPPYFELVSTDFPGGTCAVDGAFSQSVACVAPALPAGSTVDATLVTRAWAGPGQVTLFADASSLSFDPSRPPGPSANVQVVAADWAVVVDPAGAQLAAGESARLPVDVRVLAGELPGKVTLSCEGLPASLSCAFDPSELTPGAGHAGSTLTVAAAPRSAAGTRLPPRWPLAGVAGVAAALLLLAVPRRRAAGLALAAALGCGGSSGGSPGGGGPTPPGDPAPVTHTFVVKATADGRGGMWSSPRTVSIAVTVR